MATLRNTQPEISDLEKLAAELDSKQYAVSLVCGQGTRPHLTVTNRDAPDFMTENIYVAEGWFWWGWAQRIAMVENLAAAVAEIAGVLRVFSPGL